MNFFTFVCLGKYGTESVVSLLANAREVIKSLVFVAVFVCLSVGKQDYRKFSSNLHCCRLLLWEEPDKFGLDPSQKWSNCSHFWIFVLLVFVSVWQVAPLYCICSICTVCGTDIK